MGSIFLELGIIIIVATVGGYLAKLARQPLIPAYILTGLLIGPILGLVTNKGVIHTLSEIGIAFLLFIVGLEISFNKLKDVGKVSIIGGTIQILFLFVSGYFVSLILGFRGLETVYLAIVLAFSSTMVVVKILSDKKEIDTLHGRIIIGILLLQDIVAIFVLSILTTLDNFSFAILLIALFKGIVLISVSLLLINHVMPSIFKFAAKSQELLFLVSLSTCFAFALLASNIGGILAYFFSLPFFGLTKEAASLLSPGFSIAIGAFIAGIGLANLPYNYEIIGKVKSLRDFFSTIFFVSLGLELVINGYDSFVVPLIVLVLFQITAKPMIMIVTTSLFGYTARTSFITSNSLAQISEFSLIIVAQGLLLGHINNKIFSLTIMLAIITISLTSYFLKYDEELYRRVSKQRIMGRFLNFCEGLTPVKKLEYIPKKEKVDVILCGYNRIGFTIAKTLRRMRKKVLIVDFNPEVVKDLIEQKVHCIYGDLGDLEIIERLPLKDCQMVISTVTNLPDNILLIQHLKRANKDAPIFVTSSSIEDAMKLYDAGSDYVILPHFLGGEHVSLLLEDFTRDVNKLLIHKLKHIKELKHRHKLGHHHPSNRWL